MRVIPLRHAAAGAVLGREVHAGRRGAAPLLRAGAELTPRARDVLARRGVAAVYVDDPLSRGIEPRPVLPEGTRSLAMQAVASAFEAAIDCRASGRTLAPEALASVEAAAQRIVRDAGAEGDCGLIHADLSTADDYLLHHAVDSAILGVLVGRRMLDVPGGDVVRRHQRLPDRLARLATGLMLADVGKLALPASIVGKRGRLDEREWQVMTTHTLEGLEVLRSHLVSPLVKTVVRSHHERWDGCGYPDARPAAELHLFARIAAVADSYDAITSERPYAPAGRPHEGVRAIRAGSGSAFDPDVVDAFSQIVAPFPPGEVIELSDGRGGVVASVPPGDLDRPVVRVLGDGEPYEVALTEHPHLGIKGWDPPAAPNPKRWDV